MRRTPPWGTTSVPWGWGRMRRLPFAFLWIFVFVIPIEETVSVAGFGSIARIAGIGTFAVGLLHILMRGTVRPLSWFHIFAIAFCIWASITLLWTIAPEDSQGRLQTYVQLTLLVWLMWELAATHASQLSLLQAYVLGAGVAALSTLHSYLSGTSLDPGRYAGFDYNANVLGLTLVLSLPMAWYLSLCRSRLAWINRLYVPVGVIAILLTASRAAFFAGTVALLLIPWSLQRVPVWTRVAVCAGVVGFFLLALQFIPQTSWDRILTTRSEIETGRIGGRGEIWKAGVRVFTQHPVAGVGVGAFAAAVEPTLGPRVSPHQTFLAVLVEQGVIGLTLFISMFVAVLLSIQHLSSPHRQFWIVLSLALAVVLFPAPWDYRKQLWFVLGVLACQGATPLLSRAAHGKRPNLTRGPESRAEIPGHARVGR